jgi:hypothetical protein
MMTTEENESPRPQTLKAAMAERGLLYDRIRAAVNEMSLRREGLRERIVPTTRRWEQTRPHTAEKENDFLSLHNAFLDFMKDMGESQRQSTASMKEVSPSNSSLKFIRNRTTPTKALQHELKLVGLLQTELSEGILERSRILDFIDELADKMEAMVDAETAN